VGLAMRKRLTLTVVFGLVVIIIINTVKIEPEIISAATPVPLPPNLQVISPSNSADLTRLGYLGKGAIGQVAWSPDGKLIAVAGAGIYLYDAETLKQVRFIDSGDWVETIAFSPDSKALASGTQNKAVQVWKVDTGQLLYLLKGHAAEVLQVAFSPNGNMLASLSQGVVHLWRVGASQPLRTLEVHANNFTFSPNGAMLLAGDNLWDVRSGQISRTFRYGLYQLDRALLSPDGSTIAFFGPIGNEPHYSIHLMEFESTDWWDTYEGIGGLGPVTSLVFSPDGHTLAGATYGFYVEFWDANTGQLRSTLNDDLAHPITRGPDSDAPSSIAFSPDGRLLASVGDDVLRIWDVKSGQVQRSIEHAGWLTSIAFSSDGHLLAAGNHYGDTQLWQLDDGKLVNTFKGHTDTVVSLALSPDNHLLVSESADATGRLWDVKSGQSLYTLTGPALHGQATVAFSPDGQTLLSVGSQSQMLMWDVNTGQAIRAFEVYPEHANSLAIGPDLTYVAFDQGRYRVEVWEVGTGQSLHLLKNPEDWIQSIAFSPNGQMLAVGDFSGELQLWDVGAEQLIHRFLGPQEPTRHTRVTSTAFNPDGHLLASGHADQIIRLWDVTTGQVLGRWIGSMSDPDVTVVDITVAFSPDGHILASGSEDGLVRLWGVPGP